jgi:hypothetical protein
MKIQIRNYKTMEKEKTVRELLVDYLTGVNGKVAGGVLEDYVRTHSKHKSSMASRRLREMFEEGIINREYQQVNGKGPHFVVYCISKKTLF